MKIGETTEIVICLFSLAMDSQLLANVIELRRLSMKAGNGYNAYCVISDDSQLQAYLHNRWSNLSELYVLRWYLIRLHIETGACSYKASFVFV